MTGEELSQDMMILVERGRYYGRVKTMSVLW